MRKKFRLPSPAMVVACTALAVALSGASYAAIVLPKNSVGTKQLKKNAVTGVKVKNNAVTGAKVKDNSLTGLDINEATLGQVPSALNAANAANAGNANTLDGLDANSLIRVASASASDTTTSTTLLTTSITAPTSGFLVMTATIDIFGASTSAECHLDVDGTDIAASSRVRGGAGEDDCATNATLAVAAGAHTVNFEGGAAGLVWNERSLDVLFVPFGATGAIASRPARPAAVDLVNPLNRQ